MHMFVSWDGSYREYIPDEDDTDEDVQEYMDGVEQLEIDRLVSLEEDKEPYYAEY